MVFTLEKMYLADGLRFGNEKRHYTLNKIKARLEKTERLWVYFSVMTANASKIASRKEERVYRRVA